MLIYRCTELPRALLQMSSCNWFGVFLQVYGARCLNGHKAAPSSLEDASALAFDRVEAGLTGPSSVYVLSSGTGCPVMDFSYYHATCCVTTIITPDGLMSSLLAECERLSQTARILRSLCVMGDAGRHILFGNGDACTSCGELGGTLSEPLSAACFCRRQASGTDIPNTAPVLEYCPAEGLVLATLEPGHVPKCKRNLQPALGTR